MVAVDDERVAVLNCLVAMRMAMWRRALGPFMNVLVVRIMAVEMIVLHGWVVVFPRLWIGARPDSRSD